VSILDLSTGKKTEHKNTIEASIYIGSHKNTIAAYFSMHGPHFKYKHYQVSVAFDEGEDFSHCKKQRVS
jgi:hypothetical protein